MSKQCSVYAKPNPVFSNANRSCNHPTLGLPIDVPKPLRKFDPTYTVQPTNVPYLQFSKPNAQSNLDIRQQTPDNSSVFPRNIYKFEPLAGTNQQFPRFSEIREHARDRNIHYTYSPNPADGKERSQHPEYFSRFSYDRFDNEYGVGMQSRGYIEPAECHACNDVPLNMAPEEFYEDRYIKGNLTEYRQTLAEYNERI